MVPTAVPVGVEAFDAPSELTGIVSLPEAGTPEPGTDDDTAADGGGWVASGSFVRCQTNHIASAAAASTAYKVYVLDFIKVCRLPAPALSTPEMKARHVKPTPGRECLAPL